MTFSCLLNFDWGFPMCKVKTISQKELIELIRNVKGVTFANITYHTNESKSKTINKQKALQKSVTLNVTLNANYAKKVNRVRENKQGEENPNFVSQGMKGKKFAFDNCKAIVEAEKTGNKMLYCFKEHTAKSDIVFYKDGEKIDRDEAIAQELFTPSYFKPVETVGRGSIDKENDFAVFTVGLDKIKRITIKGNEYIIV